MEKKEFFGREVEADVKNLNDIKEELYDKEWASKANNEPIYYEYRDLYREEDKEIILSNNFQYDVLIIPQAKLGSEFIKTKGRYCPEDYRAEVYEILEGKGDFILQKGKKRIQKVAVVRTKTGDHVIVPSGFGYVIANTSPGGSLKLARLSSRDSKADSSSFENKKGACYFELVRGFKKNERYKTNPDFEIYDACESDPFGNREIYDLIKKPEIFSFLHKPKEEFFKRLNYY